MDRVLAGGYARGRMINVIGDSSTGKTLLAIEATINFHMSAPKAKIRYAECESAWDETYAKRMGMPVNAVSFVDPKLETIEDLFEDLDEFIAKCNKTHGGLYVVDSLDSLSDRAEMDRTLGDKTYGTNKAAKLSEAFRRVIRRMENKNVTLFIISQVRDNIGAMFGNKLKRSGGKALTFYATQIIWLAQVGKIKAKKKGIERTVGTEIRVKCSKNKMGIQDSFCTLPLIYGYGIDDVAASVYWLSEHGRGKHLGIGSRVKDAKEYVDKLNAMDKATYNQHKHKIRDTITVEWHKVEKLFEPTRSKYGND